MGLFDKLKDFGSKVIKLVKLPKLYGMDKFPTLKERMASMKQPTGGGSGGDKFIPTARIGIPTQEQLLKTIGK